MAYRTIVADPPWKYRDKLQDGKGAEAHYRSVMSTDDICKLAEQWLTTQPLDAGLRVMGREVESDAVLWLWTTLPFFLNGDAMRVARAWGFEPKQVFHWLKCDTDEARDELIVGPLGLGRYLRVDTEYALVCTRGKASKLVMRHDVRNWWLCAPRTEHSVKPQAFFDLVETITPGPYLELFAREHRPGWDAVGNELPLTPALP